jgi:hypothetical protein
MNTQPALDFCAPIAGRSPRARHASWTGAQAQAEVWTKKQQAMLDALTGRALTRNELAEALGLPITSICSVLDALVRSGHVEGSGDYQVMTWADGKQTKRERFQRTTS